VILLETVGVGQSEVEVVGVADTVVVLLAPGMGDGIQAAKAGILEIGDVFVVNKADRDGAEATARELRHMLTLGDREPGAWTPPVLRTVAARSEGIDALVTAVEEHRAWAQGAGAYLARRQQRAADEVQAIAVAAIRARLGDLGGGTQLADLAADVAAGALDPYTAADLLVAGVTSPG
jgi:LAO/AO transport system kinase